jgi:hypothetical protein
VCLFFIPINVGIYLRFENFFVQLDDVLLGKTKLKVLNLILLNKNHGFSNATQSMNLLHLLPRFIAAIILSSQNRNE